MRNRPRHSSDAALPLPAPKWVLTHGQMARVTMSQQGTTGLSLFQGFTSKLITHEPQALVAVSIYELGWYKVLGQACWAPFEVPEKRALEVAAHGSWPHKNPFWDVEESPFFTGLPIFHLKTSLQGIFMGQKGDV